MAKIMIILGVVFIVVGSVLLVAEKIPFLGKLPGDIIIKKGNVTLYFPLTTSLIISMLISFILYLIGKPK